MNTLRFLRRFFLVPTIICSSAAFVALRFDGWPRWAAVGFLTSVSIGLWGIVGVLGWKSAHDARELHELEAERDARAVAEEFSL